MYLKDNLWGEEISTVDQRARKYPLFGVFV